MAEAYNEYNLILVVRAVAYFYFNIFEKKV